MTLIEALTASPYFGAIAILLDAEIPRRESILALVAFDLLFISPPLILLWITTTLGRRAPAFLERLRAFIEREGRLAMLWLFVVVGAYPPGLNPPLCVSRDKARSSNCEFARSPHNATIV